MNHGVDLIFETDIGHDIDDFCALCYLIEAGVNINLVTICPGSPRQVAIAKFILDMCGFTDVPVGVGKLDLQ